MRREVRATANRLANFDDANLRRSARAAVAAAARVQRAIEILGENAPDHLIVAGHLRLSNRQASLEELGQLSDPPMTKDAVAGRIRRLLAMADKRAKDTGHPRHGVGGNPRHARSRRLNPQALTPQSRTARSRIPRCRGRSCRAGHAEPGDPEPAILSQAILSQAMPNPAIPNRRSRAGQSRTGQSRTGRSRTQPPRTQPPRPGPAWFAQVACDRSEPSHEGGKARANEESAKNTVTWVALSDFLYLCEWVVALVRRGSGLGVGRWSRGVPARIYPGGGCGRGSAGEAVPSHFRCCGDPAALIR